MEIIHCVCHCQWWPPHIHSGTPSLYVSTNGLQVSWVNNYIGTHVIGQLTNIASCYAGPLIKPDTYQVGLASASAKPGLAVQ